MKRLLLILLPVLLLGCLLFARTPQAQAQPDYPEWDVFNTAVSGSTNCFSSDFTPTIRGEGTSAPVTLSTYAVHYTLTIGIDSGGSDSIAYLMVSQGGVHKALALNSNTVVTTGAVAGVASAQTNQYWESSVLVTCLTTGSSGTVLGCGKLVTDSSVFAQTLTPLVWRPPPRRWTRPRLSRSTSSRPDPRRTPRTRSRPRLSPSKS